MIKYFVFLLSSIFLLSGCTSNVSIFNLDREKLVTGKSDSFVRINFTNADIKRFSSYCVSSSFTLSDDNEEYGYLFIETINLDNICKWNGLPTGFFESNLKEELKTNSIKTVEEFETNAYLFKTLKINNDSFVNLIYFDSNGTSEFVLDYEGKFYGELLKKFKPDFENIYLNKKRLKNIYNSSLIQKNLINNYFEQEEKEIY